MANRNSQSSILSCRRPPAAVARRPLANLATTPVPDVPNALPEALLAPARIPVS